MASNLNLKLHLSTAQNQIVEVHHINTAATIARHVRRFAHLAITRTGAAPSRQKRSVIVEFLNAAIIEIRHKDIAIAIRADAIRTDPFRVA